MAIILEHKSGTMSSTNKQTNNKYIYSTLSALLNLKIKALVEDKIKGIVSPSVSCIHYQDSNLASFPVY